MRNIIITESQYNKLFEGVDWTKNQDGTINISVNNNTTDKENRGRGSVDTRLFGNKNDVLYGDNTAHGKTSSISKTAKSKQAAIQYYNNVIAFVKNGRNGSIEMPDNLESTTITAVNKWFDSGKSDNYIIDAAKKAIDRIEQEVNPYASTVNRIQNTDSDRVARYMTGTVNGTNIKYIALFTMDDFNFSDAIKHGTMRQNDLTDKLLGISKDEREKGNKKTEFAPINVTYDNKYTPNIAQNFSLNGVKGGHYKQQFGLNGDNGYSSVSQFLDKSVNYAAYALKKEGFVPDFIIAPPSSSEFNTYYCTNLSNKLGIPFKKDFFSRNLINVRFDDGRDVKSMLEKGFSQKDVMDFENQVKNVAYKEISYFVSEPMRELMNNNIELFSNISLSSHSREKTPINDVFNCLMEYAYGTVVKEMQSDGDIVDKHLIKNFMQKQNRLYTKSYDSTHILNEIQSRIQLKIGKKVFNQYLVKTLQIVKQYSDILKERGYKLHFNSKRVKVTQFSKKFRPFLNNVYIVADNYLKNGQLMSQYKNAKLLIFDEDINTGATLKLCIDALEEKIPDAIDNNILCLVNAYCGNSW